MAAPSRWSCPSEDTLYRYSTGDASGWQRVWVQHHLHGCAACTARLEQWESATDAYRDFVTGSRDQETRASVALFAARLYSEPVPPRPSSLAWPRQALKVPLGWRPIAAAVVIVVAGLFGLLPIQETITADSLVARAVANDRQCPCPRADMVTIDANPHRAAAALAASTAVSTRGLMSERGTHARELAERLREYAFDWQAPLSARPYQEWRAAVAERTESYDWIASDRVRVSTHAASGRIQRAELILRTTDYRPVGQTWLFSDGFAVELRLFERAVPPSLSPTPPALNRIATADEAAGATGRSVEETEIALRVSLEKAGVMLTRRLTLRHGGERLTIAGRASSRDATRIAALARELGDVSVDVKAEARRIAVPASAPASAASNGGVSTGFEAWLDRTFDSGRARTAFLPTARQLADEFADAVAALDGLGRRFPASAADTRASGRGRDDVRWLTAAYYARVTASYERLEAHLAPLTGSLSRHVLSPAPPSHWRATSAAIAPAMRELSEELVGFAAPTSSTSSTSAAPSTSLTSLTPPTSPAPAAPSTSSASPAPPASPNTAVTADDFERIAGASLREKLVAVVPR